MFYDEWIDSIHQKDGLTLEKERHMRLEAVSFMTRYGICFKLPQISIAKGIVIFHQISKQMSFKRFDRLLYSAVCIFLASKVDDYPKPIKEFIKIYDYMYVIHRKQLVKNSSDPFFEPTYTDIVEDEWKAHTVETRKHNDLEDKFLTAEIEVLKMVGYDLNIDLPYQYLDLIKKSSIIPDANFLKIANNFINDSMRSTVCLYYEPRIIALAALNLASDYFSYRFPTLDNQSAWYKCFGEDVSIELVDEATFHIRDVYKQSTMVKG